MDLSLKGARYTRAIGQRPPRRHAAHTYTRKEGRREGLFFQQSKTQRHNRLCRRNVREFGRSALLVGAPCDSNYSRGGGAKRRTSAAARIGRQRTGNEVPAGFRSWPCHPTGELRAVGEEKCTAEPPQSGTLNGMTKRERAFKLDVNFRAGRSCGHTTCIGKVAKRVKFE